jgi:hypothetical protein
MTVVSRWNAPIAGMAMEIFGLGICKPGHYTRDTKLMLLFAVETSNPTLPANQDDSLERPRHWVKVRQAAGTDVVLFADFVDHVCTSIEDVSIHTGDTGRVLMWDNLSSHLARHLFNIL